jgi:hypothetical protein
MSVFAPAWMLQVNGVGDTHGSTPLTVYVACWTTTLATAATRRTSQLSCRDPLIQSRLGRAPVESLRGTHDPPEVTHRARRPGHGA